MMPSLNIITKKFKCSNVSNISNQSLWKYILYNVNKYYIIVVVCLLKSRLF